MALFLEAGGDEEAAVGRGLDHLDRGSGAQVGSVAAQVVGEGVPQGGGEGFVGYVEQEPLRRTEEVDVEHERHLGRGQFAGVGEEAAGEHLEREVLRGLGETDRVEEVAGADVVETGVDLGNPDVQKGQRGDRVHAEQVAEAEGRAQGDESERAPRRGARDVPETVVETVDVP